MKKEEIEEKLKRTEDCLKEKDKRLSKIENRWTKFVWGIGMALLIIGVILYIYGVGIFNNSLGFDESSFEMVIIRVLELFSFIGIGALVVMSGWLLFNIQWGDDYE